MLLRVDPHRHHATKQPLRPNLLSWPPIYETSSRCECSNSLFSLSQHTTNAWTTPLWSFEHTTCCSVLQIDHQCSKMWPATCALRAHAVNRAACLSMLLSSAPTRELHAGSESKCCALAERCGTPQDRATMGDAKLPNEKMIKKLGIAFNIIQENVIHQSHNVPNVPGHAKLLASHPEGTQSTTRSTRD